MGKDIYIDARYCGPPGMGNGGYVCGRIAKEIDFHPEIKLKLPTPLDTQLSLVKSNGSIQLIHQEKLIAEAQPSSLTMSLPSPIEYETAKKASSRFIGHHGKHPFPACFVCGPHRSRESGLHIFAGSVDKGELYAAVWTPRHQLANKNAEVASEYIWAALDCPGSFAVAKDRFVPLVLGTFAAKLEQSVQAGKRHVILAWLINSVGRKHQCGTALYTEKGEVCAFARATWITLKQS